MVIRQKCPILNKSMLYTLSSLHLEWGEFNNLPVCSPLPPWYPIKEQIDTSFPIDTKNANSMVIRTTFNEMCDAHYPDFTTIFTDGSMYKSPTSCTSAMYVPSLDFSAKWKLTNSLSIVSAELFGILKALQFTSLYLKGKIVILSDSKTALMLIKSNSLSYRIYTEPILSNLLKCKQKNIEIKLQWIPSHSGIPGNETVDTIAKEAHNLENGTNNPIAVSDESTLCRNAVFKKWLMDREPMLKCTNLGKYREDNLAIPLDTGVKSRKINVAIRRLRIGHCRLNYHLKKIRIIESASCEYCNMEETIEHVLMICPRYHSSRIKFKSALQQIGISFNCTRILGKEGEDPSKRKKICRHLAVFLIKTGLIDRI